MNCQSMKSILSRYADHEASERERVEVEQHVGSCPACASYLHEMEALNGLMAAPAPIEASSYLWLRVKQGIVAAQPERRWLLARWRPVYLSLAAGAVVVVCLFTAQQLSNSVFFASRTNPAGSLTVEQVIEDSGNDDWADVPGLPDSADHDYNGNLSTPVHCDGDSQVPVPETGR